MRRDQSECACARRRHGLCIWLSAMANHSSAFLGFHRARCGVSVGFLVMLAACGSNVDVENSSGAATAGSSGSTGGASTSGTGSAGGSSSSVGAGGGASGSCESLGHTACLAAYPDCVPVYDDACCPMCNPTFCADCVNYEFHHCAPYAEGCAPDTPFCGFTVPEHCAGQLPACGSPNGSPALCGQWPGCTYTECPVGELCDVGPHCTPVTPGACTVVCKSLPPECPPEMVAEADGDCWTGMCIMADVCPMP
jgi:hypothetical protein